MGGTASAKPKKSGAEVPRSTSRDDTPFVEAAWLYYHDGLNQNEIADRMNISRASVVMHGNKPSSAMDAV